MTPRQMKSLEAKNQSLCDAWNAKHPVGTPVTRYRLVNPLREPQQTKTRSEAWSIGYIALVSVEGVAGGVLLESVVPL
jgi:hypothetical protein